MRVLITGGAGCLGAALVERFAARGADVLVLDNFATGSREAVPAGVSGVRLREGTIADRAFVDDSFEGFRPTHVVHAAAAYKDPDDWREDIATNVTGSANVVLAARAADVERFINLQTALCYGTPERVPVPVDHPCRPVSSYGISKTAGEAYVAQSGLAWLSLRLASVIGPGLAIGAIPTFYTRLKAGKSCFCSTAVRDFLDMEDFLAFMDLALAADGPVGTYNLGPGTGHSISEVFATVARAIGLDPVPEVPIVPVGDDDVETVVLDPARTEADFGWRARVTFEQAIARTVAWYDAHGVGPIRSHLKPATRAEG